VTRPVAFGKANAWTGLPRKRSKLSLRALLSPHALSPATRGARLWEPPGEGKLWGKHA